MAHAQMFDEDDPTLARLEGLCLGFPHAKLKVSHGRPAFYTTKVFAYYGGSIKVDGSYVQHDQSLVFLPSSDEAEALAQDERVYRPAYLGAYGWLGLDLGISWSCYDPQGDLHCGLCDSCRLRARGFVEAGLPDPTRYAEQPDTGR